MDVEGLQYEAQQLIAEGRERGFPLALSHLAVQLLLRKHGVPIPDDILAFTSKGKMSDSQVTNWLSPVGD